MLLLFGAEYGHPAAGPESVYHVGSRHAASEFHRPAEVRGERARFRHGHPDAYPAQAARDAARLLQAPRRLVDHEEARVPAVQALALRPAAARSHGGVTIRGHAYRHGG